MAVHLLDVNVLIALGWPNHKHHALAQRWFSSVAANGWATCPLTECGFVRVSANAKAVGTALSPAQAVATLVGMTKHEHHMFWADDLPVGSAYFPAAAIQGHQQITDAYLLALCVSRGGQLATFDTAIGAIIGDPKLVTNIPQFISPA